MMSPIIFYTLDPRRRRGAPVLPRAARPQERHGRARRLDALLQPQPVPDLLQLPGAVVRRDDGLAPVRDRARRHARPVPARPGAGSSTRASDDDASDADAAAGALPAPASSDAGGGRRRPRPEVVIRSRDPDVVDGRDRSSRSCRRSPTARYVAQDPREQISQPNSPLLPSNPATFEYQGKTYDVYYVPMPDGTTRELALVKKGRQRVRVRRPREPRRRARSPGRARGERSTSRGSSRPQWDNYAEVWDLIDFPRLLFNTVALALIGTFGTCCRARSSRTASPGSASRAGACCSPCCSRRSSCRRP